MNEKNYLIISYKQFLTLYVLLKNIYEGWWFFFSKKCTNTVCPYTYSIDPLDIKNRQNQAKRFNICVILNANNV